LAALNYPDLSPTAIPAGVDFDTEAAREAASYRQQKTQDLILDYLPLVDSIARRVYGALPPNTRVELPDLAQSGSLGLVSAGKSYDPDAAVPFPVYARFRVEGEILDSLRRHDLAPRKLRRWQKQASLAKQELAAALNREPTEEELCERLQITSAELHSRTMALHQASEAPVREDQEATEPTSHPNTHPDHIYSQQQLRRMLERLTDSLPEREQLVIKLHYARYMTMKEIGNELGVNESRASQIHRRALQALERMLRCFGIYSPADV
jgi:RNA polymerase sigma factor for flagellar operon FliA